MNDTGLHLLSQKTLAVTNRSHWDFIGSLYFATTIVTTIGKGQLASHSMIIDDYNKSHREKNCT